MPEHQPRPFSATARRARRDRAARIARRLGFVGRVEYRHVYSGAGGAQYGPAASPEPDLLIVYAEAFERDACAGEAWTVARWPMAANAFSTFTRPSWCGTARCATSL